MLINAWNAGDLLGIMRLRRNGRLPVCTVRDNWTSIAGTFSTTRPEMKELTD